MARGQGTINQTAEADSELPASDQDTAQQTKSQPTTANNQADNNQADSDHDNQEASGNHPAKSQHRWRLWIVVGIVVALMIAAGVIWGIPYLEHVWTHESTDDAFIDAHDVRISPKVSGYAIKVAVNDNQLVTAGDLLVQIDRRDYEVALDQANADLAAAHALRTQAVAQKTSATASVETAQAELASAQASREDAEADLRRVEELIKRKAATSQLLDQTKATAQSAEANVRSMKSKIAEAQASVAVAEGQIASADAQAKQAQASIERAKLNLNYTTINSPIDGRIAKRNVDAGDYLQAGQSLLSVVPQNVYVTANYKETQLTNMKVGQPAQIEVDAFPDRPLKGHVDSFQPGTGARFSLLPPENATGNYVKIVQRVPVKIVFDEPPEKLKHLWPGLSVVPDVKISE